MQEQLQFTPTRNMNVDDYMMQGTVYVEELTIRLLRKVYCISIINQYKLICSR